MTIHDTLSRDAYALQMLSCPDAIYCGIGTRPGPAWSDAVIPKERTALDHDEPHLIRYVIDNVPTLFL